MCKATGHRATAISSGAASTMLIRPAACLVSAASSCPNRMPFSFSPAVLIIRSAQQLLDLVWEILLPAFGVEQPAEDAHRPGRKAKKLSSLTLAPAQKPLALSLPPHFTKRTYEVDVNDLGIESIDLDFTQLECVIVLTNRRVDRRLSAAVTASGDRAIPTCLIGGMAPGCLTSKRLLWSGGWASKDCFTMVVRLLETPFFYSLAVSFHRRMRCWSKCGSTSRSTCRKRSC